jgi:hypothetical protein
VFQKKALRIINSAGPRDHCRQNFVELGVLTIFSQYVLNSLLYVKENLGSFTRRAEIHPHSTRRNGDGRTLLPPQ